MSGRVPVVIAETDQFRNDRNDVPVMLGEEFGILGPVAEAHLDQLVHGVQGLLGVGGEWVVQDHSLQREDSTWFRQ